MGKIEIDIVAGVGASLKVEDIHELSTLMEGIQAIISLMMGNLLKEDKKKVGDIIIEYVQNVIHKHIEMSDNGIDEIKVSKKILKMVEEKYNIESSEVVNYIDKHYHTDEELRNLIKNAFHSPNEDSEEDSEEEFKNTLKNLIADFEDQH